MKLALSIGCMVAFATTVAAATPGERQAARALYDLTASSAQALENAPFDRPANQRLKAALEEKVEAFSFDMDGKDKDALFNCEYAARQLTVILADAILAQRPAPPERAKLMQERASDWATEMNGCRRFLKAPAAKVDMRSLTRRIAGN